MAFKPKIITKHVYPPIPVRQFDWSAVRDGYEPNEPMGWGETEAEAIDDLLFQEQDILDAQDEAREWLKEARRQIDAREKANG